MGGGVTVTSQQEGRKGYDDVIDTSGLHCTTLLKWLGKLNAWLRRCLTLCFSEFGLDWDFLKLLC